jgi:hypothetical protein
MGGKIGGDPSPAMVKMQVPDSETGDEVNGGARMKSGWGGGAPRPRMSTPPEQCHGDSIPAGCSGRRKALF